MWWVGSTEEWATDSYWMGGTPETASAMKICADGETVTVSEPEYTTASVVTVCSGTTLVVAKALCVGEGISECAYSEPGSGSD